MNPVMLKGSPTVVWQGALLLLLLGFSWCACAQSDLTGLEVGEHPVALYLVEMTDAPPDLVVVSLSLSDAAAAIWSASDERALQGKAVPPSVSVLKGLGNGRFRRVTESALFTQVATTTPVSDDAVMVEIETLAPSGLLSVCVSDLNDARELLIASGGSQNIFRVSGAAFESISRVTYATASGQPEPLEVGSGKKSLVLGDFDEDGIRDVALATYNSRTLAIYHGDARGSLYQEPGAQDASPVRLAEWTAGERGDQPFQVLADDLTGNGCPDLIVAKGGLLSQSILVFLNAGDGHFPSAPLELPATRAPRSIASGDIDNDGTKDLLIAGLEEIVTLKGLGQGSFGEPVHIAALTVPTELEESEIPILLEDLSGDGWLDLVTASPGDDQALVFAGDRSGGFTEVARVALGVGTQPIALASGDIDMDGDRDIAVACYAASDVRFLLNAHPAWLLWSMPAIGSAGSALGIADITMDGTDDLVIAQATRAPLVTPRTLTQSIPAGSSQLTAVTGFTVTFQDIHNHEVLIVHGDSDAHAESNGTARAPGVIQSDPSQLPKSISLPAAWISEVVIADFNEASPSREILLLDVVSNAVKCLEPRPSPTATDYYQVARSSGLNLIAESRLPSACLSSFASADLTRDSHFDLALASFCSNRVYVMLGTGTGNLESECEPEGNHLRIALPRSQPTGASPSHVCALYANSDEVPDLVVTNPQNGTIQVLCNQTSEEGGCPAFGVTEIAVGTEPLMTEVADLNGDGFDDLVVCNHGSNDVSILLNDGTGHFAVAPGSPVTVGTGPVRVAVAYRQPSDAGALGASLDANDIPDLVIANYHSRDITVLFGNGDGSFAVGSTLPEPVNLLGAQTTLRGHPISVGVLFADDEDRTTGALDIVVLMDDAAGQELTPTMWDDVLFYLGPLGR